MKRSVACRCLPCRFLRAEERDIHTACNGPFPRRHACSRGINGCERRQQDLLELELYILGRLSRLTFPLSHFKRRGLQLLQRIREIPASLYILSRGRIISSSLCTTRIPYRRVHLANERINLSVKSTRNKGPRTERNLVSASARGHHCLASQFDCVCRHQAAPRAMAARPRYEILDTNLVEEVSMS